MEGGRFVVRFFAWVLALVGLALVVGAGRSQVFEVKAMGTTPTAAEAQTCVIYSLAEFGDEPELAKWIAETIPEVIEPGSWHQPGVAGKKQVLRYFAPKRVLVVYHTPAVHAKVDAFLKDMKKTLPGGHERTTAAKDPGIIRARYQAPALIPPANSTAEQNGGYPVPASAKPPKHLFHFIIRYEGEGIVDNNVVQFMKAQAGANAPPTSAPACAICPVPPPPAVSLPAPVVYGAAPVQPAPKATAATSSEVPALSGPPASLAPESKGKKSRTTKPTPKS
jgi:hypothetical protein